MLLAQVNLPLRNVHTTDSIPWWPLAPGWWMVIAVMIAAIMATRIWLRKQRERKARVLAFFDEQVSVGETAPAQIAQVSQLLRRAARQHHPNADKLQGDEWLILLNKGTKNRPFTGEVAELLLNGPFKKDVKSREFEYLLHTARERFATWVRDV